MTDIRYTTKVCPEQDTSDMVVIKDEDGETHILPKASIPLFRRDRFESDNQPDNVKPTNVVNRGAW